MVRAVCQGDFDGVPFEEPRGFRGGDKACEKREGGESQRGGQHRTKEGKGWTSTVRARSSAAFEDAGETGD